MLVLFGLVGGWNCVTPSIIIESEVFAQYLCRDCDAQEFYEVVLCPTLSYTVYDDMKKSEYPRGLVHMEDVPFLRISISNYLHDIC